MKIFATIASVFSLTQALSVRTPEAASHDVSEANYLQLFATINITEGNDQPFIGLMNKYISWVNQNEPHTYVYELMKETLPSPRFVLHEEYPNHSALSAHQGSPQYSSLFAAFATSSLIAELTLVTATSQTGIPQRTAALC